MSTPKPSTDAPIEGPRVVMLGPPGSGKGTHSRALATHFSVPHVSTGALLRREIDIGSALGRRVAAAVTAGELVGDAAIVELVRAALDPSAAPTGWVLDGAPRTVDQARLLAPVIEHPGPMNAVAIALEVSEAELRDRLLLRGQREGRTDDEPEVILHRLALWLATGPPLLDWYERRGMLRRVDGEGSVDDVSARVIATVADATRRAPT